MSFPEGFSNTHTLLTIVKVFNELLLLIYNIIL